MYEFDVPRKFKASPPYRFCRDEDAHMPLIILHQPLMGREKTVHTVMIPRKSIVVRLFRR